MIEIYNVKEASIEATIEIINLRIKSLQEEKDLLSILSTNHNFRFNQTSDAIIKNIVDKYVEVVEHKKNINAGGIGGPQQTQTEYFYTLKVR